MTDYKNLTNEELLEIIDSGDADRKEFQQIKLLTKTDPEFRSRIVELKVQNKKDQKGSESALIEVLEKALSEASEDVKPKIQERLDAIKKIFDRK